MQQAARASPSERQQLGELFAELCRIESPSGRERGCAARVSAELEALGLDVHEDDAGPMAGSDCGNLLARIPARVVGAPSMLLCAHLDTVPLEAAVDPVIVDDGWENANAGILGADNKAAIAVMLALARRVCREGAPVDIELLFTVGEETALAGARAFDVASLRSDYGYVFDHASPIGELVIGSPSHFRVEAAFHGAAAHAGIRPQEGRSAIVAAACAIAGMPHGRLDEQTTVNVGTIAGGSAMNVVAEHCSLLAEVRSLDAERAEAVVAELIDAMHEAANLPDCDCDLDLSVQRTSAGYRLPASAPALRTAETALRACGYQPTRILSGGASDANALFERGLTVVNMANGTERNHEPGERVAVAALEGMLEVALALPHATVTQSPGA